MSHPTQAKFTSQNPSGTDDSQMPVEEEGGGFEFIGT